MIIVALHNYGSIDLIRHDKPAHIGSTMMVTCDLHRFLSDVNLQQAMFLALHDLRCSVLDDDAQPYAESQANFAK